MTIPENIFTKTLQIKVTLKSTNAKSQEKKEMEKNAKFSSSELRSKFFCAHYLNVIKEIIQFPFGMLNSQKREKWLQIIRKKKMTLLIIDDVSCMKFKKREIVILNFISKTIGSQKKLRICRCYFSAQLSNIHMILMRILEFKSYITKKFQYQSE